MLQWAAEDWKSKGSGQAEVRPHGRATTPIRIRRRRRARNARRNSASRCCRPIQFALTPGDYTAQCLTLKQSGANYAYLGNTAGSNISVLKACQTVGVEVQFLGNVWGMDENADEGGRAMRPTAWSSRCAPARVWTGDAPGMKVVREITKSLGPGRQHLSRRSTTSRGVCTRLLHEGGDGVGRQERRHHRARTSGRACTPRRTGCRPGCEGVCLPSTWTDDGPSRPADGRLYRAKVSGATEAPLADLAKNGTIKLEKVDDHHAAAQGRVAGLVSRRSTPSRDPRDGRASVGWRRPCCKRPRQPPRPPRPRPNRCSRSTTSRSSTTTSSWCCAASAWRCRKGGDRGAARRQRRRQVDDAEGDLGPAQDRGRRGHPRRDPVRRPADRRARSRTGSSAAASSRSWRGAASSPT